MEKVTAHVFPIMKDEVKALYKEGTREVRWNVHENVEGRYTRR